ncbi:MAG: MATE family efflux transporter [Clostridia bacterium]|nr:MATE family efflux transporter [Clostridia bacterium]MBQ6858188.1 MATE family efflux transporter [Clostridia bacterium]
MEQRTEATQRPLFSRSDIRKLLFPLVLEQLLAVSMGMADTMMVSSVGEAAISGVSLVDNVNVLILQVLSALATGGAVVASQYLGRGDTRSARRGASQLYATLMIITVSVAALCIALCRPLLRLIFGAIDDEVMGNAMTYFYLSAVSYPFMGLYGAGAALFRAQGDSRTSMLASLVMNIINVTGNALLIFVFDMGVLGAAIATLIGRVFAALYVTWRLQRPDNLMRIGSLRDLLPDMPYIRRILSIGVPSGLENGMFHFGKLILGSLISTLGTAAIAANAVANSIGSMCNIPGNAVSLAMIPVVGRCIGAGKKDEAKKNADQLMWIAFWGLAATSVISYAAIPHITSWFSLSPEAAELAVRVIRSFNLMSIPFWATSFTLPNALRSGGDAKFTMTVSMFSMWLFRVLLCYVFVLRFDMGLMGIWTGMYIDWICRTLLFLLRYRSGKWMEHKVI